MAPHDGLVHLKKYDIKDSNVELISSDLDHRVKYRSAATEPAWNDGHVGAAPGLFVWRVEDFAVVRVPPGQVGTFFDGDSYVVLHSYKDSSNDYDRKEQLGHDIFFWLGTHTSQDEAGTAAYKAVELDEFLRGAATQHREVQEAPSDDFMALFPRLIVRRGGVVSGFHHVEAGGSEKRHEPVRTLLRVFRHPGRGAGGHSSDSVVVHEVEPSWRSLDEADVFVLDTGDKIWVWQGQHCSPMEKAKAAQVVHDMTMAKHVDVEVLAQAEPRSRLVMKELGGEDNAEASSAFKRPRPMESGSIALAGSRPRRLFRLSDATGQLTFDLMKEGPIILRVDLDANDFFLFDDGGATIWIWEGGSASHEQKANWLRVAQTYVRRLQIESNDAVHLTPIKKVREGNESTTFLKEMQ